MKHGQLVEEELVITACAIVLAFLEHYAWRRLARPVVLRFLGAHP